MPGGRPRKIHSKPTSGAGGRELTDSEIDAIIKVVDHYLGDDELVAIDNLLERIWKAYGSYLAWEDALHDPASAGEEVRDIESIIIAGTKVYRDIESFADQLSMHPEIIVQSASEFATRLRSFPVKSYGLIVSSDPAGPFAQDKRTLQTSIVQVRFWDMQREQLLEMLERFLLACQRAPVPKVETKPNGLHIIGVCQPLEHSNKHENKIELYTHSQSIAFGIGYQCVGVTDVHCDAQVKALVNQYLTRIASTPTLTSFECQPTGLTDEQIIEKARKSHSALRKLQGKATFSELFDGLVAEGNENDLALARCLAFWTGRDPVQIERIMYLSKRVRDKWSHRRKQTTWLRQTIEKACAGCEQVYLGRSTSRVGTQIGSTTNAIAHSGASAGQVGPPTAGTAISDAAATAVERILEAIKNATSELVLANQIAPEIQAAQFPLVLQAKVVQAYKSKLKKMGADLGVAQVRALLAPNGSPSPQSEELPAWARPYVYVNDGDHFFNTESCTPKTLQGFRANYNRYMPRGDFGRHGDAAEACLTRFGMETVDRLGYKPDEGARYIWQGARYANLYNPKSVPLVPAEYSQVGRAGIQAFCDHFFDMCGRRQDVCNELFHWFAHNVQYPGRKIR